MAALIVYGVAVYLGLGLMFAIAFALRGAGVIDPGARNAPLAFKALIVPGAALLWPVMLRKWMSARRAGAREGQG